MQSISLVILAAGLGSRYRGQKQTDGMGPNQESLLDYAIYDGLLAGFTHIVFVVRESMMPSFKEALEARWDSYRTKYYPEACFEYVLQKIDDLPECCKRSVERTKPWGTAHALWAARDVSMIPLP
jgi:dTDP-glucose pyrophosphorylase